MGVFLPDRRRVSGAGLRAELRYLEITITALLFTTWLYTVLGGMLSVLVTDYLQFIGVSIGMFIVTTMIFVNVGWTEHGACGQQALRRRRV